MKSLHVLTLVSWLWTGSALAQTAPPADNPICADRPGKGAATCTAPAGHWQLEMDAVDLTHSRSGGVTNDTTVLAGLTAKYGVTDRFDLELALTPWQSAPVSGPGGGHAAGFGDMLLRTKLALTAPGGPVTAALDPYVKLPTAPLSLGNGAVEAGVVAPVSVALPNQMSLAFSPEADWRLNGSGAGRHWAWAGAVGLGAPLTPELTGGVELWGQIDQDPAGETRQASFDLSLAYIPAKAQTLQLDGGVNLGLNRATADVQVYVGASKRF